MGSRSRRASSGSRSATCSVDPFMSEKSTVTCFRSPSRAASEVRTRLARGLGAWKYGDANRGETICPVPMAGEGVPQLSQNLLSAVKLVPQTAQRIPNASPHSRQNRASSRFSCRHLRHCITRPPASGAAYDQTAGLPDRDSRDLFKLRSGLSGSRLPWGPLAAMAAPRALGIEGDSHRHDIMARVRHVAPNPSQRHQPACKPGSVGCRPLALTICDGRFFNCEERVAKGARSSPDRDAFANHHICSWGTSRSTAMSALRHSTPASSLRISGMSARPGTDMPDIRKRR